MATYIALLRKEKDSDFGVDFPDFPGGGASQPGKRWKRPIRGLQRP